MPQAAAFPCRCVLQTLGSAEALGSSPYGLHCGGICLSAWGWSNSLLEESAANAQEAFHVLPVALAGRRWCEAFQMAAACSGQCRSRGLGSPRYLSSLGSCSKSPHSAAPPCVMAAVAVVFSLLEVAGKPRQVFSLVALGGGPGPLPPVLPVVQLLPEGTHDAACVARLSQLLVAGYPIALQAVWRGLVDGRAVGELLGSSSCCLRPLSLCSLCQGPTSCSVSPSCDISVPWGLASPMAVDARAVGVPVAWQSGH